MVTTAASGLSLALCPHHLLPSCQHEETVPGGEDLASRTCTPRLLEETDNFNHKAIFGRPQARRESPHGPGLNETRQLVVKDHFPLILNSCSLLGLNRDLLTSLQRKSHSVLHDVLLTISSSIFLLCPLVRTSRKEIKAPGPKGLTGQGWAGYQNEAEESKHVF